MKITINLVIGEARKRMTVEFTPSEKGTTGQDFLDELTTFIAGQIKFPKDQIQLDISAHSGFQEVDYVERAEASQKVSPDYLKTLSYEQASQALRFMPYDCYVRVHGRRQDKKKIQSVDISYGRDKVSVVVDSNEYIDGTVPTLVDILKDIQKQIAEKSKKKKDPDNIKLLSLSWPQKYLKNGEIDLSSLKNLNKKETNDLLLCLNEIYVEEPKVKKIISITMGEKKWKIALVWSPSSPPASNASVLYDTIKQKLAEQFGCDAQDINLGGWPKGLDTMSYGDGVQAIIKNEGLTLEKNKSLEYNFTLHYYVGLTKKETTQIKIDLNPPTTMSDIQQQFQDTEWKIVTKFLGKFDPQDFVLKHKKAFNMFKELASEKIYYLNQFLTVEEIKIIEEEAKLYKVLLPLEKLLGVRFGFMEGFVDPKERVMINFQDTKSLISFVKKLSPLNIDPQNATDALLLSKAQFEALLKLLPYEPVLKRISAQRSDVQQKLNDIEKANRASLFGSTYILSTDPRPRLEARLNLLNLLEGRYFQITDIKGFTTAEMLNMLLTNACQGFDQTDMDWLKKEIFVDKTDQALLPQAVKKSSGLFPNSDSNV